MKALAHTFASAALLAVMPGAAISQPSMLRAVEYYHAEWGHYFVTALPEEINVLDNAVTKSWIRTGQEFNVYALDRAPTGTQQVCRFFSDQAYAPISSHFHTPFDGECAGVMKNPKWLFEGRVFAVTAVSFASNVGTCPLGTQSVYRMYNNGQGGAPNHRYITSVGLTDQMFALGWCDEGFGAPPPGPDGKCSGLHHPGVIFCSPN